MKDTHIYTKEEILDIALSNVFKKNPAFFFRVAEMLQDKILSCNAQCNVRIEFTHNIMLSRCEECAFYLRYALGYNAKMAEAKTITIKLAEHIESKWEIVHVDI